MYMPTSVIRFVIFHRIRVGSWAPWSLPRVQYVFINLETSLVLVAPLTMILSLVLTKCTIASNKIKTLSSPTYASIKILVYMKHHAMCDPTVMCPFTEITSSNFFCPNHSLSPPSSKSSSHAIFSQGLHKILHKYCLHPLHLRTNVPPFFLTKAAKTRVPRITKHLAEGRRDLWALTFCWLWGVISKVWVSHVWLPKGENVWICSREEERKVVWEIVLRLNAMQSF